jgi:hypothetical protein
MLIGVLDRLCAELGGADVGEVLDTGSTLGEEGVMSGILSLEDEQAVMGLRAALVKITAVLSSGAEVLSPLAVRAALDGSEMVMRGELVNGRGEQLPKLMPGFVFLVALPIVDQDRALELSRRATELIARELG